MKKLKEPMLPKEPASIIPGKFKTRRIHSSTIKQLLEEVKELNLSLDKVELTVEYEYSDSSYIAFQYYTEDKPNPYYANEMMVYKDALFQYKKDLLAYHEQMLKVLKSGG